MSHNKLIIVTGQEGVGKSTLVRALLPHTPNGAQIDAEDLAQTNPCPMDARFMRLVWENVTALIRNFWAAGYTTVIAGSFLDNYQDYIRFRPALTETVDIYLVHLCAAKAVRDQRRVERVKPSSPEWRDHIDRLYPEDLSFGSAQADYRYIRVDNSQLSIDETVQAVKATIPEVFGIVT